MTSLVTPLTTIGNAPASLRNPGAPLAFLNRPAVLLAPFRYDAYPTGRGIRLCSWLVYPYTASLDALYRVVPDG
jgi:hypothetical protein